MDVALLSNFSLVFTFLLVFAIIFALLEFLKIFGENKPIHAIIALSAGLLTLFSKSVVQVVNNVVPWFMVLLIIAVFGIVGYRLFAGPDVNMGEMLKESVALRTWIIVVVAVVFIIALSMVFGQNIGPYLRGQKNATTGEVIDGEITDTATGSFAENLTATLFHPKVVGMVFILLIALFSILFLAGKQEG